MAQPTTPMGWTLAFVVLPGMAAAQDYESEARLFRIEDAVEVREDNYTLPLTIDVIPGVLDALGGTLELTGSADVGMLMEGESQLRWPVVDQPSTVEHEVTPLEESAFLGMTTRMQLDISVTGTVLGQTFNFAVVSEPIEFTDEVRRFTPFLLPNQVDGDTEIVLQPEPASGFLDLPLQLIDTGGGSGTGFSLQLSANVNIDPTSRAAIRGVRLNTEIPQGQFVDTFSSDGSRQTQAGRFPNDVALYDPTGSLQMSSTWEAETDIELGYRLGLDLLIGGSVLGQSISFTVPVGEFDIPLFPEVTEPRTFTASPDTSPWRHPLPLASTTVERVVFGDVPGDVPATQTVALANRGELDLQVQVAVEGSDTLTARPVDLTVSPGGANSIVVTYTPGGPGSAEGELVLTTSDPANAEIRIPIAATAVEGSGDGDLSGDPNNPVNTPSDPFVTCGCASSTAPSGAVGALGLLAVAGIRRRRR